MWKDPIVDEIRAIRRKHTEKFGGDVRAICEDLRRREQESGREFVTFADQPAAPVFAPLPNTTAPADASTNSPI
jgi:hypothetical protein